MLGALSVTLTAVLLGFGFGFVGSIPVAGPVSALVVSRGVAGRFRSGAYLALGGGIAEALYAFLAFWGVSALLSEHPSIVPLSRAAAAVILAALGWSFARGKVAIEPPERVRARIAAPEPAGAGGSSEHARSFVLGLTITALNPTLIATWTAVVTTLLSSELVAFGPRQALPFSLGACVGIAGWFVLLLELIRRHRGRFRPETLARVLRAIGVGLLLLAAWFAWRFAHYALSRT
jgi:threonine/homoserine/homoserine lactone efflux protein